MTREEKATVIEDLKSQLAESPTIYLTDISGLDAGTTSALRRACFKANIKLAVVKNTLLAKAMDASFPEGERTDPTGGFFIWWRSANEDFDSKQFMEEFAIPNDILYVPGGAFYPIVVVVVQLSLVYWPGHGMQC